MLTYPSITGDVSVNKRHNAYVDALSQKKGWGEGDYVSSHKAIPDYYYDKERRLKKDFNPNEGTKRGYNGDLQDD